MLMSIVGMGVLLGLAYAFSRNRAAIAWRTVLGAFAIQLGLGAFVLKVSWGQALLASMTEGVNQLLSYGDAGIAFLFGGLVAEGVGFTFALKVLPIIVFFASLIAVLYHIGLMKWIIRIIGGALQKVLGTSRAESMSATANIFVGQTEAPLVVKPFIATMTQSELFAVMVGGLASVAGSALAGYALIGVPVEYLIAACFMSAPGGLLFAKLLMPETEEASVGFARCRRRRCAGECHRCGGQWGIFGPSFGVECGGHVVGLCGAHRRGERGAGGRRRLVWHAGVDP